jgi:Rrf2 family protein
MLSKKAQYAFHALIYLAENSRDHPVLISEIAQQKNISIKFLENILLELKNAGILGSKKGKGGGYYLLKAPKDIPLARIIRLLDGPIALLPCVSLNYYEKCETCRDEATCGFHQVMSRVRDATLTILENKTVNDILHGGKKNILNI